jgi:hypothetical protein
MQRQVPETHRSGTARARTRAAGFFLAMLAALVFHAGESRAQLTIPSNAAYSCDFENSYCDFYEQSKVASSGGRRSSMVGHAASGQVGVKLTTLSGDNSVNGSGTWERNDLAKRADASYCNPGQEEWWAFSILFPSDFVFPPGPEAGIVMDFHHTGSSGQANYEIQTIPGIGLRARGYGGASVNSGKYDALIPDPHGAAAGTVARNVWYHFVLHVRWSPNGDGFMEGWVNGRKYQSYQGATLYAGQACYLKLANYHGPFGQSSSVVFDRVVRGGSASAVSALTLEGVGNPPIGGTPGTPGTGTGSHALSTVTMGSGGGTVTSAPSGINCGSTCSSSFASGTTVTLNASPASGSSFAGWSGACSGTGSCTVSMTSARSVTATFNSSGGTGGVSTSASSVGFGGAAGTRTVSYTNNTSSRVTFIRATMSSAKFSQTNNCGEVAPGASCTATITYSPGNSGSDPGTLTLTSTAPNSPHVVTLSGGSAGGGSAGPSLVPHFYRTILRREPDAGGKAFWEGELARVTGMGAASSEVWFAMTSAFFASAEYAALRRDDAGFVTDLYASFLDRAPDATGMAGWTGLIAQGLPRDILIASFMFSPEFAAMTGGAKSSRMEVDTVLDFYRGLLARLPDSSGYSYWLAQFRSAQCRGAAAVAAEAEAISASFANGAEAGARGRGNAQYVADLYNALLRRGGDLAGVRYWIQEIDRGARSRDDVRRAFLASPEFSARVQAVVSAGCAG